MAKTGKNPDKERVPVVKNETVSVRIRDLGNHGEGIGTCKGYTLFVPGALPGEEVEAKVVKVKPHFGIARLEKICLRSPERTNPVCPAAGRCGGCQLQHLSYAGQLRFKENRVRELLIRIAGVENPQAEPIIGMADWPHYRNKAQFPVRAVGGRLCAGFYAPNSHRLVEVSDCLLQSEISGPILSEILSFCRSAGISAYDEERGTGLLRHILIRDGRRSGEVLVCLVVNERKFPHKEEICERLRRRGVTSLCLNYNFDRTNVILGPETRVLMGPGYIHDTIGPLTYRISQHTFFQVNPAQTEKLYRTVLEMAGLTGAETVWDAYCGAGTISLFLARFARKVYGVEIVPEAVEDARANARDNGIRNAEFYVGKAEDVIPKQFAAEENHAQVMVLDPPRSGCDPALLTALRSMAPERIVYVSCDPATLARDVKQLCEGGLYRLGRVRCVDMFPQTVHVETACQLSRIK